MDFILRQHVFSASFEVLSRFWGFLRAMFFTTTFY